MPSGELQPVDEATVSVYPIAEALAFQWWRLFGRRDDEFRLFKHRCGYALPDLRLNYDGERLAVTCRAREYANPPILFYRSARQLLLKDVAESNIGGLIDQVIDRLHASSVSHSALALRWERVRASIGNADERAFCEAAGAMGLDPYGLSDQTAAPISGVRALVQFDQDDVRVHLTRHRPESALFAFGRAVGDAIGNPPVARSVVNDLHDASRQAVGRAFAAEFLAPMDEILSMRADGKDAASIAGEFGVSEEVVERQLQNRNRIERACAA